jgi:hypothetical protein
VPVTSARGTGRAAEREIRYAPKMLTRASFLVVSLLFAVNALAQWPSDARVTIQKVNRQSDKKTVSIVRKCYGNDTIVEFLFEYPQFRGRSPAIAAVNRAIETSFSVNDELQDCAETAPRPSGESPDGVSCDCDVSSRHAALVTIRCHRAANVRPAAPSGSVYFMNFDMATGHKLKITDLVSWLPEFTKTVRAQLVADYPAVEDDEFVDELVANLVRSCGLAEESVVCSTLAGTHAFYEVDIPISRVCNLMAPNYFSSTCRRHD